MLVNPDSDVKLVFRDQQRAQCGYIAKEVGPYPAVALTAQDVENDARIQVENERRSAERIQHQIRRVE